MNKNIYCCACSTNVNAVLTSGTEIYPHRKDLEKIPFWKCLTCLNFVGCHYKTKTPLNPLGCIPTPEIKNARNIIHRVLDPIWQNGHLNRRQVYIEISKRLGYRFHAAEIRDLEQARKAYKAVMLLKLQIQQNVR